MDATTRSVGILALLALLGAGALLFFLGRPSPPEGAELALEDETPEAPAALERPPVLEQTLEAAGRREVPILGAARSEDPEWRAALGGIQGRVVEHDGAPAADLKIEAVGDWLPVLMEGLRSLLALEEDRFQPGFASARTDREGRFMLWGFYPRETALLRIAEQGETLLTHPLPGAPGVAEMLDIGDIRLPRFATVSGRVEDQESGDPLAGARVWVSCLPGVVPATGLLELRGGEWLLGDFGERNTPPGLFRLPRALAQVRGLMSFPGCETDHEGRFTLKRVHPGRASLIVEKQGYQPARRLSFPVPAGRARDMGTIGLTVENQIHVLIREADGRPAAGVEVLAGVMPALVPVAIMQPIGITGESGEASACGIPDGRVFLAGRRPGRAWNVDGPFAQGEELVLSMRGGGDRAYLCVSEERPVEPQRVQLTTLLDHENLPGYVSVEPGGKILLKDLPEGFFLLRVAAEGYLDALEVVQAGGPQLEAPARIVFEPEHFLEVLVRDAQERPLPGARLLPIAEGFMFSFGADLRAPHIRAFFTDLAGRVRVGPLAKGEHKLGLWHPRHGESLVDAVVPSPAPLIVTLACGRIEGWLEPPGPPPAEGRWLVYLTGESVRPLTAAPVCTEGRFAFEGVAPGRWELAVLEQGPSQPLEALIFALATGVLQVAGRQGGIQVHAGQTTRVALRLATAGGHSGTVEGVVRQGGRPAEGFLVVARSGSRRVTASTGPDGTYRLEGVPAGRCFLEAGLLDRGFESEPRRAASAILEVEPGLRIRHDFDLPGGSIEGIVKDDQGRAMVGLHVRAKPVEVEGARGGIDALTDAEGRFAMPCVAPGLWELTPQGETVAARGPTRVALAPGQESVWVEIVAARRLLVLLALEPAPSPDTQFRQLRWRPAGGREAAEFEFLSVEIGAQIRINALPGPIELEYWEKGRDGSVWIRRSELIVPENPSGPIRALLGPAAAFESVRRPKLAFAGTFTDAEGKGLGPGQLSLGMTDQTSRPWFAPREKELSCPVDAQGGFSIEAPAGRYWFFLRLEGPRKETKHGRLEIPPGGQLDALIRVK